MDLCSTFLLLGAAGAEMAALGVFGCEMPEFCFSHSVGEKRSAGGGVRDRHIVLIILGHICWGKNIFLWGRAPIRHSDS